MKRSGKFLISLVVGLCAAQSNALLAQHLNDVWELSMAEWNQSGVTSPSWSQLSPAPDPTWGYPAPRRFSGFAHDTLRNRLLIVGGENLTAPTLKDVWALNLADPAGASWTRLPDLHATFSFRACAYDSRRDQLVVLHMGGTLAHIDVLDLASGVWQLKPTTGANPESLSFTSHSGFYDPVNDGYVVFGGGTGSTLNSRVRALDATTLAWADLVPADSYSISPLMYASGVYDPAGQRMLVFGGASGSTSYDRTFSFGLPTSRQGTWTELTAAINPPSRSQHAAAFDSVHKRMFIFGGLHYGPTDALNDTWSYDGGVWCKLAPTGALPANRRGATAVYDHTHDRLIVFGGQALPSAPPSNLAATMLNDTELLLTWQDNAINETSYVVYRVTTDGTPVVLAELPADSTYFTDVPCGDCVYAVRSINSAGLGAFSAPITVINPPPAVTLASPATGSAYPVGAPVSFAATFTDTNYSGHSGYWTFDGLAQAATISEPSAGLPGLATADFIFTAPGVYRVALTLDDGCGGTGYSDQIGGAEVLVVIYDPSAGFVTGGGWINSPPGAYAADWSLTGKATFGFVSRYHRGAITPVGETEFQFRVGNLNFHSTAYDWLVISGPMAQYKGTGEINGAGTYQFLLTATDGQVRGGGGVDKFRIHIWSGDSGVIYDSTPGMPTKLELANPQAIEGGSIVIYR